MGKAILALAVYAAHVTILLAKRPPPGQYGPGCPKCKEVEGEGPLAGTYYFAAKEPQCENGCAYEKEGGDCCYCFEPGSYPVTQCEDKAPKNETLGVVLLGGIVNGVISNEARALYPKKCRPIANLPENVTGHSSVGIEGAVVSCGGVTIEAEPSGGRKENTTADCWKYSRDSGNPLGEWYAFPNLPQPLQSFGMTVVDNFLMVLGGNTEPGDTEPAGRKRRDDQDSYSENEDAGIPFVPGPPLDDKDFENSLSLDESKDAMHTEHMNCEHIDDHIDDENNKRIAVAGLSTRWPNGIVPYTIEEDFNTEQRALIAKGLNQIETESCVTFREKKEGDTNWVEIATKEATEKNLGCNAILGYPGRNYGASRMNLQAPGCMWVGTVVHEMLHILGFKHEHVRPDRDQYVTLRWSNIKASHASNYWRAAWETENVDSIPVCTTEGLTSPTSDFSGCRSPSLVKDFGVKYDYKSIMHYGFTTTDKAFVVDTGVDVMTPSDASALSLDPAVGSATKMSANDVLRLKAAYSCDGCGGHIRANSGTLDGTKASTCEWIINTEANRGITITFTNFKFSGDCSKDYLEVRYGDSKEGTLIGKYCSIDPAPAQIVTKSSRLWVYSVKSTGSADTWSATWTTTEMTCCSTVSFEGITGRSSDMGLYTLVEGKEVAGRPLYKQKSSKTDNYLYYYGESAWFVSDNYTSALSGIRNKEATYCPEDAVTPWQSYEGKESGWVNAKDASCRCSDCSKYPDQPECATCCDTVALEGLDGQTSYNGLYKKQESELNGRLIYKQDDTDKYLIFDGGWKGKGSPTEEASFGIENNDATSYCPEKATDKWQYYAGQAEGMVKDADAKARCSDCSKTPTLPECVTCCTQITMNSSPGYPFGQAWTATEEKANGKIVYKNDASPEYCLWTSPCGKWVTNVCTEVSSKTKCGSYISSTDSSKCPQTASWSNDIQVKCKADCTKNPTLPECETCCDTVALEGLDGQTSFNALYKKLDTKLNERPIYKQDGQDRYLLFDGAWKGKDTPTAQAGSYIKNEGTAYCPDKITAKWQYPSGGAFVPDADAKTRCSDCSKNPSAPECVKCCSKITLNSVAGYPFGQSWTATTDKANGNIVYKNDENAEYCLWTSPCGSWVAYLCTNVPVKTSAGCTSYITSTDSSKCPQTATWPEDKVPPPQVTCDTPNVKPTQPPVKPTQPPVNPTQPTVKSTEINVKPTERPVKSTQPPVKPTELPVEPTKPATKPIGPLPPTRPSVKPTGPPINPTGRPPINPTGRPPINPTGRPPINPTGRPPINPTGRPPINPTGRPPINPTGPPMPSPCSAISNTWRMSLSSAQGSWTPGPALSTPRYDACTMEFKGMAVITGGRDCSKALTTVEGVSPRGKRFPLEGLNVARYSHGCVAFDDMMMVAGGIGEDGIQLSSVEIYKDGMWMDKPTSLLPQPRFDFPMLAHMDMPVVFGGAPGELNNNVLVRMYKKMYEKKKWVDKMQLNFTIYQQTAVALYPIGLC